MLRPSTFRKLLLSGGSLYVLLSLLNQIHLTISTPDHIRFHQNELPFQLDTEAEALHTKGLLRPSLLYSQFISPKVAQYNGVIEAQEDPTSNRNEYDDDNDWELDNYEISWGSLDDYHLSTKLGEGEYAEVFEALDAKSNRSCVVKLLKPVSKRAVKREIKILNDLRDAPNVVELVDVVLDQDRKAPALVMEFVNNTYYRKLYPILTDLEVRYYMFQLLRAVEFAHSKNIMHRDIKPHNLLIDHDNRKLRLIDWGLSDYFDENYSYTTTVASRFWRAPELLVGYEWYNLSSDVWAFGCLLAGLVFGIEPFFYGRYSDTNQLINIAQVLGTEDLFKWLDKYEIQLPETFNNVTAWYGRTDLTDFVDTHNQERAGGDVVDLLHNILLYDHNERLTATEALAHSYFDLVRDEVL